MLNVFIIKMIKKVFLFLFGYRRGGVGWGGYWVGK